MNNALTKTLTSGLMHGIISMYNENPKAIGRVISVDVLYNNCTIEFSHGQQRCEYQDVKPYLFPMQSLTKEIEHKSVNDGSPFNPMLYLVSPDYKDWDKMKVIEYNPFPKIINYAKWYKVIHEELGEIIQINPKNILVLPFNLVQMMVELNFNVFGLSPEEFIEVNETNNPYR